MARIENLSVVGRLAPSPTGAQHVGNARTYVIAWLSARTAGKRGQSPSQGDSPLFPAASGRVVLRIEDIDSPRVKAGAAEQACADLTWLGLDWDEGPVIQTSRLPLYAAALERLRQNDVVYPCTCSRSDVDRAASAPHLDHEGPVYPGTCASRRAADVTVLEGRPYCWRFRVPEMTPGFVDGFLGPVRLGLPSPGGGFVVWKAPRGGLPATPADPLAAG